MKVASKHLAILAIAATIIMGTGSCTFTRDGNNSSPQTHTVEIKQMAFSPNELTIKKGDTVVFVNKDLVDHNVTDVDKQLWSSSTLHPGKTWSKEITESANYYCSLHVVMKGKIIVQ